MTKNIQELLKEFGPQILKILLLFIVGIVWCHIFKIRVEIPLPLSDDGIVISPGATVDTTEILSVTPEYRYEEDTAPQKRVPVINCNSVALFRYQNENSSRVGELNSEEFLKLSGTKTKRKFQYQGNFDYWFEVEWDNQYGSKAWVHGWYIDISAPTEKKFHAKMGGCKSFSRPNLQRKYFLFNFPEGHNFVASGHQKYWKGAFSEDSVLFFKVISLQNAEEVWIRKVDLVSGTSHLTVDDYEDDEYEKSSDISKKKSNPKPKKKPEIRVEAEVRTSSPSNDEEAQNANSTQFCDFTLHGDLIGQLIGRGNEKNSITITGKDRGAGQIKFFLKINKSGEIRNIDIKENTINNTEITQQIMDKVNSFKFRPIPKKKKRKGHIVFKFRNKEINAY